MPNRPQVPLSHPRATAAAPLLRRVAGFAVAAVAVLALPAATFAAPPKSRVRAEKPAEPKDEAAPGRPGSAAHPAEPLATPTDLPISPVGQTPVGEDALRLGPFVAPPKAFPFPLLGDDRAREVFVDRAGQLYKDRPYGGHIPDWSAAPPMSSGGRCKVEAQALTWVGFQNNADGSRIFVQLERLACGYVYRPDDLHIVIDLPAVAAANPNLRRDILTGAFPTAVDFIRTEEVPGRGVRVIIALKDKRPYLSAHLGRYVFVDIPR